MYTLTTGEELKRHSRALVLHLKKGRRVLSTAHLNGGCREDVEWILNFDSTPENGSTYCQNSATYVEDLKRVARKMGLDEERTAAISTTVHMEHASICEKTYKDLTVTTVATAGIAGNAGRVGDPAWFHEENGIPVELVSGTINIILLINLDLNPGTMTRCIVTATEAKTAVLQELMAGSVYSDGLATGTGTDETVIVCDSTAANKLMFAGKHSKLGELIGITVKSAVKDSLKKFAGLDEKEQRSVTNRMKRFGFSTKKLLSVYREMSGSPKEDRFLSAWENLDRDEILVAKTSLFAHLLDQMSWGLLSPSSVWEECHCIFTGFLEFGQKNCPSGNYPKGEVQEKLLKKFDQNMAQKTLGTLEKDV